jgi:hypothetical protein
MSFQTSCATIAGVPESLDVSSESSVPTESMEVAGGSVVRLVTNRTRLESLVHVPDS